MRPDGRSPAVFRAIKLARLLREPRFRRALLGGVAASVDLDPVLPAAPLATVIDGGANRGQFSLLIRARHPGATLHAFEPLPAAADRYARLFAGDAKIRLHRRALGAETGTADLHVSGRPDNSSLLPIAAALSDRVPGTAPVGRIAVPVDRLDRCLDATDIVGPALLKLDLQGGELAALTGAGTVLDRFDYILAEVSFIPFYTGQPLAADIAGVLHGRGFAPVAIGPVWRDRTGRALQTDLLFARRP
jgi:FkbM family methyltransferase